MLVIGGQNLIPLCDILGISAALRFIALIQGKGARVGLRTRSCWLPCNHTYKTRFVLTLCELEATGSQELIKLNC